MISHNVRLLLIFITLAWVTPTVAWSSTHQIPSQDRYRVLVLHSYHQGMQWEDRINNGLLSELDRSGLNLEIYIERMDTKRYPKTLIFPHLVKLYAEKYPTPPDIIIVTDDNALDFVVEHRNTLFRDVPVVFVGINDYNKARRVHRLGFTGLAETIEITRTLKLILQLHPETERIIAVADTVPSAKLVLEHYRAAATEITKDVEFGELSGWTLAELKESLVNLPENTVLLYLSVHKDRDGRLVPPPGEYRFLLDHTSRPIYTLWEHMVADGVIGGVVADGTLHGKIAAGLVLQIFRGKGIEALPVLESVGNRPVFDYQALKAHQLPLSVLPADSLILNEPQTFYYRYYKRIWITFSFLILQTVIIIVLVCLINRSRRGERAMMQRANLELEAQVEVRTQELKHRTQELERSNEELNQFTYIASHDLQEPVRNLISYSTLLKEDLGDDLSEGVAEDLFYIIGSASRMQRLVQDLLGFSRAGRAAVKKELVALDDCVDTVLEILRGRIEECGADVYRVPLPTVMGDETLLTQLYQNLIGNALKFASDEPPTIRITAERDHERWLLAVSDNGIGLEPEYAEQIFKPFKRLHGMGEYEGTGIGLSICQKVVERHNGTIWVESEPRQGALFQFTLPVS